jgi:hypothetical protein
MTGPELPPADQPTEPFDCPRCGAPVEERLWGPCRACRAQLVASYARETVALGTATEPSRFEPAMHVVPNHVATKD